ncbi:hypothetical protein ACH3XW_29635 [Acanthocheilonema viteae]
MLLTLWKKSSPIMLSALSLLCICSHTAFLTHIVHGRLFDIDPSSLFTKEFKLIQSTKQRSKNNLRNCFFSPVQCLLPFDDSRLMQSNSKRRTEFPD